MTKVKQGIESFLSGKFGDKVYVQRDGKTYVRSVPKRRKDSSTPAMLLNQKRFKEVMRFCGQFKNVLIPQVWNLAAVNTSGFRLFQKANSPAFAKDGSLQDPKLIRLSTGKLALPKGFTAGRAQAGSSLIEVSWERDLHLGGIDLQDELIVISAGEGQYSGILETGIVRNALHSSFELPGLPTPATHIYLFFSSKDKRNYSESVCMDV
jgi:hypothetical protein